MCFKTVTQLNIISIKNLGNLMKTWQIYSKQSRGPQGAPQGPLLDTIEQN